MLCMRIWNLPSALMSSENSYQWFLSRVKINRLELIVLWASLGFCPLWKYPLNGILPNIRPSCGSSQFVTVQPNMHNISVLIPFLNFCVLFLSEDGDKAK